MFARFRALFAWYAKFAYLGGEMIKTPVIHTDDHKKSLSNIREHFKAIDNAGGVVTVNDMNKAIAEAIAKVKK